ncbi:hypothetical protein [Clostridium magnum]|uniref:hypothetical protein n=1 Tax=Clostridium magnum TaxID=33954 RepID=UPI0009206A47|nr:hypothetical protein [Clostridium magnum]SHJ28388.1 hypothetical protein SAMN02745944_05681 [Clostridium magnum DSM 2767]
MDVSCFTRSKNVKDGYQNKCKKCRLEQSKKYINICIVCGSKFRTAYKKSQYCSPKCKASIRIKKIKVRCFICGKEKEINPYTFKHHKHFYCSRKCQIKGHSLLYSGKNHPNYSDDTQVLVNCKNCGKEFYKIKSQFEKYDHHYCSKECQAEGFKNQLVKENNPHWNPNITDEEREKNRHFLEYNKWRIEVFERDNYTCQCCGDNKGGNLRAHHILNYAKHKKLRLDVENGKTLCHICHKNFHDKYGYTNNTREQLEEFIKKVAYV